MNVSSAARAAGKSPSRYESSPRRNRADSARGSSGAPFKKSSNAPRASRYRPIDSQAVPSPNRASSRSAPVAPAFRIRSYSWAASSNFFCRSSPFANLKLSDVCDLTVDSTGGPFRSGILAQRRGPHIDAGAIDPPAARSRSPSSARQTLRWQARPIPLHEAVTVRALYSSVRSPSRSSQPLQPLLPESRSLSQHISTPAETPSRLQFFFKKWVRGAGFYKLGDLSY